MMSLPEMSLRDGVSVKAVFTTSSLSPTGKLVMSLRDGITMGFITIVSVVFSLSFIKFIACAVLSVLLLFERQPKPKGPPLFSKEGGALG